MPSSYQQIFEYFKIGNLELLLAEIIPLKIPILHKGKNIYTTKWLSFITWQDIYIQLDKIVKEYSGESSNCKEMKYIKGSSVIIGYQFESANLPIQVFPPLNDSKDIYCAENETYLEFKICPFKLVACVYPLNLKTSKIDLPHYFVRKDNNLKGLLEKVVNRRISLSNINKLKRKRFSQSGYKNSAINYQNYATGNDSECSNQAFDDFLNPTSSKLYASTPKTEKSRHNSIINPKIDISFPMSADDQEIKNNKFKTKDEIKNSGKNICKINNFKNGKTKKRHKIKEIGNFSCIEQNKGKNVTSVSINNCEDTLKKRYKRSPKEVISTKKKENSPGMQMKITKFLQSSYFSMFDTDESVSLDDDSDILNETFSKKLIVNPSLEPDSLKKNSKEVQYDYPHCKISEEKSNNESLWNPVKTQVETDSQDSLPDLNYKEDSLQCDEINNSYLDDKKISNLTNEFHYCSKCSELSLSTSINYKCEHGKLFGIFKDKSMEESNDIVNQNTYNLENILCSNLDDVNFDADSWNDSLPDLTKDTSTKNSKSYAQYNSKGFSHFMRAKKEQHINTKCEHGKLFGIFKDKSMEESNDIVNQNTYNLENILCSNLDDVNFDADSWNDSLPDLTKDTSTKNSKSYAQYNSKGFSHFMRAKKEQHINTKCEHGKLFGTFKDKSMEESNDIVNQNTYNLENILCSNLDDVNFDADSWNDSLPDLTKDTSTKNSKSYAQYNSKGFSHFMRAKKEQHINTKCEHGKLFGIFKDKSMEESNDIVNQNTYNLENILCSNLDDVNFDADSWNDSLPDLTKDTSTKNSKSYAQYNSKGFSHFMRAKKEQHINTKCEHGKLFGIFKDKSMEESNDIVNQNTYNLENILCSNLDDVNFDADSWNDSLPDLTKDTSTKNSKSYAQYNSKGFSHFMRAKKEQHINKNKIFFLSKSKQKNTKKKINKKKKDLDILFPYAKRRKCNSISSSSSNHQDFSSPCKVKIFEDAIDTLEKEENSLITQNVINLSDESSESLDGKCSVSTDDYIKSVYNNLRNLTVEDFRYHLERHSSFFEQIILGKISNERDKKLFQGSHIPRDITSELFIGVLAEDIINQLAELCKTKFSSLLKSSGRNMSEVLYIILVIIPELVKKIILTMPCVKENGIKTDLDCEEMCHQLCFYNKEIEQKFL